MNTVYKQIFKITLYFQIISHKSSGADCMLAISATNHL
jgi:hypothetical protein